LVLATKRAVGSEYGYPGYRPYTEEKPTVKTSARKKASPRVGLLVIALLFALGLSYTFLQATKAQLRWQVNKAKELVAEMQMNNEKLKLEAARLKSLDRIEAIAISQLKMEKAERVEYLAINNNFTGSNSVGTTEAVSNESGSTTVAGGKTMKDNLLARIAAAIGGSMLGDSSDSRWSE